MTRIYTDKDRQIVICESQVLKRPRLRQPPLQHPFYPRNLSRRSPWLAGAFSKGAWRRQIRGLIHKNRKRREDFHLAALIPNLSLFYFVELYLTSIHLKVAPTEYLLNSHSAGTVT